MSRLPLSTHIKHSHTLAPHFPALTLPFSSLKVTTHHCSLGELLKLKHTHGAVPHNGLALLQGVREGLDAVWANVQTLLFLFLRI